MNTEGNRRTENEPDRSFHRPALLSARHEEGWYEKRARWRTDATPEIALAVWMGTSLFALVLGLGLAKYSQAWAQDAYHPAAIWGALVVVMSTALAAVAGVRYLTGFPSPENASRGLVVLSITIVLALGWAALAMIAFAGWEFPPRRP